MGCEYCRVERRAWDWAWPSCKQLGSAIKRHLAPTSSSLLPDQGCGYGMDLPVLPLPPARLGHATASSELLGGGWGGSCSKVQVGVWEHLHWDRGMERQSRGGDHKGWRQVSGEKRRKTPYIWGRTRGGGVGTNSSFSKYSGVDTTFSLLEGGSCLTPVQCPSLG